MHNNKYTDGHACFLLFFLPLAFIGAIIAIAFEIAGGTKGFIVAIIAAAIIYSIWFNNSKNDNNNDNLKNRTIKHH
jgi:hypothetical protein